MSEKQESSQFCVGKIELGTNISIGRPLDTTSSEMQRLLDVCTRETARIKELEAENARLQERVNFLNGLYGGAEKTNRELNETFSNANRALDAEILKLRGILRRCEWVQHLTLNGWLEEICPVCFAKKHKDHGHKDHCELMKVLK